MEHTEHVLCENGAWRREPPKLLARLSRWAASWQAEFRRARTLRLIARAVGDDDHLLSDIGFDRDGDRIIPVARHFSPGR
jgi:hypothetical protein